MILEKFQPNIPNRSGEKDDFIDFAIFSTGCHLDQTDSHSEALYPWFQRLSRLNGRKC